MAVAKSKTAITTGLVRFSYAHVFEPSAINDGDTLKYSVALIIPKSDKKTIQKIEDAIEEAKELGKASKWGGKVPKKIKLPLRDGDEEKDDEVYANAYFVNASSTNKPSVVDENIEKLMDRSEFYSGCYGRASLNFYPFSVSGNNGIACGLNNLQKLKDGDPLAGGSSAELDFAEDMDDDDLL